jgi:hypothetical protein
MTQEPIAYINVEKRTLEFAKNIFWHTPTVANIDRIPLFTQRTWVGLTDEEAKKIETIMIYGNWSFLKIIKDIEAKLKQKNGYAEENT